MKTLWYPNKFIEFKIFSAECPFHVKFRNLKEQKENDKFLSLSRSSGFEFLVSLFSVPYLERKSMG